MNTEPTDSGLHSDPKVEGSPRDEENGKNSADQQPQNDEHDGDFTSNTNQALLEDVTQEWAGGTSVHGVALASDRATYSLWFRTLWVFMVVSAGAIMIWQISSLIEEYLNYEVSANTDFVVPDSLEFPEITLCSSSTFSMTRLNETGIQNPTNAQEFASVSTPFDDFFWGSWFNDNEIPSESPL
mmetsp:Transcript_7331/g.20381  ORF Transcript_7331/g.20381 Transcript_7331/m.20381 type:complete len:184 (-) Transcript_7331:3528-4079(-)